jgi:2-keto-4-pentenoate hydratase/2-oxohepta-3-ene-1,7-dioic acid hydratase in catechol pathway
MTNYIFKNNKKMSLKIGKLVCLARTYKKHAIEMSTDVPKDPILFLKPASSVIFNDQSVTFPKMSNCLNHEVELGVVIGKRCKNISKKNALDYVIGYVVAIDITARDIQSEAKKKGLPWSIAKGFDTFSPLSEVILKNEIKNPNNLDLSLKVNGEIRQKSNTKYMIFTVEEIIEYISKIMTLEKGDLIMTGTPEGVGEIKRGDFIEGELENFSFLKVNVI